MVFMTLTKASTYIGDREKMLLGASFFASSDLLTETLREAEFPPNLLAREWACNAEQEQLSMCYNAQFWKTLWRASYAAKCMLARKLKPEVLLSPRDTS